MRYEMQTMGQSFQIKGATPQDAITAYMERHYSDIGRQWTATPDPTVQDHYEIRQRGRYVTFARVTETKGATR